jgi:hypothetical protein
MAENKTQPTDDDVEEFLAGVPDERRRDDARAVMSLMSRVTGEPPVLWGSAIIGFGSQHYVGKSGREGDWMVVGVSPRKAALSIYGVYNDDAPDPLFASLGAHTTGKGCLYVKRLSDVDPGVLEALIRNAWQHPAIAGA